MYSEVKLISEINGYLVYETVRIGSF